MRHIRRISRCRPQFRNRQIDGVIEIAKAFLWPGSGDGVFAGNDFARTMEKCDEDLKRLIL